VSDLGGSLERWLEWVNKSASRAVFLLVLPVLVYVFGLGTWSFFWSGSAIREAVGNGLPADAGVIWATIFVGLTLPAVVFSAFVILFSVTRRFWSLVLLIIAFAPVVFSAAVNPGQIVGKTRRISRSIDELTAVTGDAHVAEVIYTAVQAGKTAVVLIALGSAVWAYLLFRRRRFADISSSHRAEENNRLLERHERRMRMFLWGYPVLVVVGVPLIALTGAANAA